MYTVSKKLIIITRRRLLLLSSTVAPPCGARTRSGSRHVHYLSSLSAASSKLWSRPIRFRCRLLACY